MATWLGLNPNCYTGGDCWDYDYSDRWLLIIAIGVAIPLVLYLIKKYLK
jgi:hypothetical protein